MEKGCKTVFHGRERPQSSNLVTEERNYQSLITVKFWRDFGISFVKCLGRDILSTRNIFIVNLGKLSYFISMCVTLEIFMLLYFD